jgi:hypothetical protein
MQRSALLFIVLDATTLIHTRVRIFFAIPKILKQIFVSFCIAFLISNLPFAPSFFLMKQVKHIRRKVKRIQILVNGPPTSYSHFTTPLIALYHTPPTFIVCSQLVVGVFIGSYYWRCRYFLLWFANRFVQTAAHHEDLQFYYSPCLDLLEPLGRSLQRQGHGNGHGELQGVAVEAVAVAAVASRAAVCYLPTDLREHRPEAFHPVQLL